MIRRVALLLVSAVGSVAAQGDRAALEARWRLDEPTPPPRWGNTAAASLGSPLAFGPDRWMVFTGGGYQAKKRGGPLESYDGIAAAGVGVGRAEVLALEATVTSFSTVRSGFLKRNTISVKVHRAISARWSVAAGYENALELNWSGQPRNGGESPYAVVSGVVPLRRGGALVLSAGAGGGRFRSLDAIAADDATAGAFGTAAWQPHRRLAVIADWPGHDLNAGLSVVPVARWPLSVTAGFADITGRANGDPRFVASFGLVAPLRGWDPR